MEYADQSFGALLFALVSLPITLMILTSLVQAFYSKTKYITVERIVEVEVPKTVYVDRPVVTTQSKKTSKTSNSRAATSDKIKTETLKGLRSLGLTSAEGRLLINKIAKNRAYKDSEQLIKDCIANM